MCSSPQIIFVALLWTHSQQLHVLLVLGAPELDAVLLVESHQSRGAEELSSFQSESYREIKDIKYPFLT